MFVDIEPLLRTCTKLTLSMQMKGDEMVVFVMPQGTANDTAMLQPLALTAPAAELDADFAQVLATYTGAHASLAEQVAATAAILEAAQKTQVSKATKALNKPAGKTGAGASDSSSGDLESDEDEDEDKEEPSTSSAEPSATSTTTPAAEKSGTDLASLF
jgi:PRTRC genetic system protein E